MNKSYFEKEFKYSGDTFEEITGEANPLNDAVGRVAMCFSELEDVLSSSITYLLKTDAHRGLTVTSEMSYKSKLHVMSSLIKQEYEAYELAIAEDDFNDLLYMCSKSEELRNTIIHSSWVYDHSKKTTEIRRRKVSAKLKRGYRSDEEPLTPGQVLDIADYIIYTAVSVEEFCTGCFSDYKRVLEHVVYA